MNRSTLGMLADDLSTALDRARGEYASELPDVGPLEVLDALPTFLAALRGEAAVTIPRDEYVKWVEVLGSADQMIDHIFDARTKPGPHTCAGQDMTWLGNWVRAVQRRMAKVVGR